MSRLTVLLDDSFVTALTLEAGRSGVAAVAFPPYDHGQPLASALGSAFNIRLHARGVAIVVTPELVSVGIRAAIAEDPGCEQAAARSVAAVLRRLVVPHESSAHIRLAAADDSSPVDLAIRTVAPDIVVTCHSWRLSATDVGDHPVWLDPGGWARAANRILRAPADRRT